MTVGPCQGRLLTSRGPDTPLNACVFAILNPKSHSSSNTFTIVIDFTIAWSANVQTTFLSFVTSNA